MHRLPPWTTGDIIHPGWHAGPLTPRPRGRTLGGHEPPDLGGRRGDRRRRGPCPVVSAEFRAPAVAAARWADPARRVAGTPGVAGGACRGGPADPGVRVWRGH